jgi:hypothetical protein
LAKFLSIGFILPDFLQQTRSTATLLQNSSALVPTTKYVNASCKATTIIGSKEGINQTRFADFAAGNRLSCIQLP